MRIQVVFVAYNYNYIILRRTRSFVIVAVVVRPRTDHYNNIIRTNGPFVAAHALNTRARSNNQWELSEVNVLWKKELLVNSNQRV